MVPANAASLSDSSQLDHMAYGFETELNQQRLKEALYAAVQFPAALICVRR